MGDLTKDEIRAQLDKLGAPQPPTNATRDELMQALNAANTPVFDDFDIVPGDAVSYCLTEEHAVLLTVREARFARFVKGVTPFDPRTYTEGDALYGRVFSAYEDGTATIDLLGSFPRLTLDRIPPGDEPGTYRKQG